MFMSVEGIYENGTVYLLEPLFGVARTRVVVMVSPDAFYTGLHPASPTALTASENPSLKAEDSTGNVVVVTYG